MTIGTAFRRSSILWKEPILQIHVCDIITHSLPILHCIAKDIMRFPMNDDPVIYSDGQQQQ